MDTKGSHLKGLIFFLIITSGLAHGEVEGFIDIPENLYDPQLVPKGQELIRIETVNYKTSPIASFCVRPVEMIDTIVIHHSETQSTDTPQKINEYHLLRGTPTDPWYMVAYSFLINTPYPGGTIPKSVASYGRPITYVGAHAGSNVFVPMDETQKKIWDSGEIKCGKFEEWVYDPSLVKNGKIKANVTTIGMVVIGNYAPGGPSNINGKGAKGREPTPKLIDMFARLSCQLQKQYPRIKKLSYHNKYHSTSCPGTIQYRAGMEAIQLKAREYGCEFKTEWQPEPRKR